MNYIVIVKQGSTTYCYGPFENNNKAWLWASKTLDGYEYEIIMLYSPA